jgi:predicted transcriptional regulator
MKGTETEEAVTSSSDRHPREPRYSIRTDARLDAETRQKVDDLARHFHQPRAAVLSSIMHWGLSRRQTEPLDQGESHGPVRHLYCYVASDLHAHMQQAATAAGVKTAPWLRHMVRQITMTDFPKSWQEERSEGRSHDSRTYGTRFMLRLDPHTREKLEGLSTHFDTSIAEVIRQLIAQAEHEDFPPSWQMGAAERRAHQTRQDGTPIDREPRNIGYFPTKVRKLA